jgi:putative Holliday junction resolvase
VRRVIGVDFGQKRVGLALSDPLALTARPLEVVSRDKSLARISELVEEHEVGTVVVGLPNPLGGGESESARLAREFGVEITEAAGVEVVYVDERYTSNLAERSLLESGLKRRERREIRDKVAAAIILQTYLDGNSGINGDVDDTGGR